MTPVPPGHGEILPGTRRTDGGGHRKIPQMSRWGSTLATERSPDMAKSVLVLGGTRFVGLHAVIELVRRGYEVTVLNRGTHPEVLPPGVKHLKCDRKDEALLRGTLESAVAKGGFDAVVDPSAYVPSDVEPVIDVLGARVGSYVFISSGSVYRSRDVFPWYEDLPQVTGLSAGAYGYNKKLCEDALMEACGRHGFPARIIRPGYIYGPHNTVYREAYFFDRIRAGRPVLVPGTGVVLSQFGYVDDLANLIILAMKAPRASGQAFNFAGRYMRPLDDYVRACARAVATVEAEIGGNALQTGRSGDGCSHGEAGDRPKIIHYWPEDVGLKDEDVARLFPYRWRVSTVRDISKARYTLGYEEKTTLDEGLTEACRWYFGEVAKGRRPFQAPDYAEEDRIARLHP